MNTYEELWNSACEALNHDNNERALKLFKNLSANGDWRGSYMSGVIHESDISNRHLDSDQRFSEYRKVEQWYERALSQQDHYLPHYALARYHYFGLGGSYDYRKAYEHLSKSNFDEEPFSKIMMAELLVNGLGTKKNIEEAERLFASAVNDGYPAGFIGLGRIEKQRKHYLKYVEFFIKGFMMSAKLIRQDSLHPKLSGIGGKHGMYRVSSNRNPQRPIGNEKIVSISIKK